MDVCCEEFKNDEKLFAGWYGYYLIKHEHDFEPVYQCPYCGKELQHVQPR